MFKENVQLCFFGGELGATVNIFWQAPIYIPSLNLVVFCRDVEPARIFLVNCVGMGNVGKDMK